MKMVFSRLKKFFESDNNRKIDWIVFGVIAIILFCCYVYWDIFATTAHTVNFIEVISRGQFFDFYKINYGFIVNGVSSQVCYDLPIYFILMVWNLPLWICQHFFNIDLFNNFFTILWMKGILVLFVGLCAILIKKICEEININKKYIKWVLLVFLSSPLLSTSVLILSQTDIIPIFFMLLGVLSYLKNDKKFILWFAIAIPMKLISLFIFIPLLLLKEKRIFYIIKKSILVVLPLVFVKFFQNFMPMYGESVANFNDSMIGKLFESTIGINFGGASLFVMAYVILCAFCYMKNLKNNEETNKFTIYISFLTYLLFLLFVPHHPYWAIYIVPFATIMLFQNAKNFKVNILLEMLYSFLLIFIQTNYYSWCFGAEQVRRMLPSFIIKEPTKLYSVASIYNYFGVSKLIPIFLGVFLGLSILLAIINFPQKTNKNDKLVLERSLIWTRMIIIIPFAILMLVSYICKI